MGIYGYFLKNEKTGEEELICPFCLFVSDLAKISPPVKNEQDIDRDKCDRCSKYFYCRIPFAEQAFKSWGLTKEQFLEEKFQALKQAGLVNNRFCWHGEITSTESHRECVKYAIKCGHYARAINEKLLTLETVIAIIKSARISIPAEIIAFAETSVQAFVA